MTLRKVTDESAVEEGGREVALKKGVRNGRGDDKLDRSQC